MIRLMKTINRQAAKAPRDMKLAKPTLASTDKTWRSPRLGGNMLLINRQAR
jgi:hypothetical protein